MVIALQLHLFALKTRVPDTPNKEAVGANSAYLYGVELPGALGNVGQVL